MACRIGSRKEFATTFQFKLDPPDTELSINRTLVNILIQSPALILISSIANNS